MQKRHSAPAFSLDSVPIVSEAHSLGDVEGTTVTGRSRTKVTTFRAKITRAGAAMHRFPLGKVTKVTPASDSARTVQLVHVERSRRLSRTCAHAWRAQLWQLSHVRASSLRAAQPRGNPVARLDCFATLAMTT